MFHAAMYVSFTHSSASSCATIVSANRVSFAPYICEVALTACGLRSKLSTEAKLHKALRENLSGVTVIMIAQRIASVMRAAQIAVLENGSICAFGTHKELMESSSVYRDIYYSQMKQGEEEAVNGQ
mgnify:CR=1 FL=1